MGLDLITSLSPFVLMVLSVSLSALAGFLIARAVYMGTRDDDQGVLHFELARMRRRASSVEAEKAALRTEVERNRRRLRRV